VTLADPAWPATALGLAAALGGGLLIGLERERRKGRGARRAAAGIRSFALAALGGGVAQTLQQPMLVALGAALVAALVAVAYWKSRGRSAVEPEADPGLTTELALFITYLVGVLSVQTPTLGAGAAVVVATLLATRERLHRFATQALSEAELHDALLLAALALVLLPLAPAAPPAALQPWVPVAPRTLLLTVVLILALQAAGHVAGRVLGARAGLVLAGLFSGFVSSTATVVALGGRVRARAPLAAASAGAVASTAATWLQALLLVAVLAPAALPTVAPVALAGAALAALAAAALWWRAPHEAAPPPAGRAGRGPLRVREAVAVAALLAAVAVAVAWAQRAFGALGALGSTALASLVDAHAPVAALSSLHAAGLLDSDALLQGLLVAVAGNSATRLGAAFVAGGQAFGLRVGASLLLSLAGAAVAAGLWR